MTYDMYKLGTPDFFEFEFEENEEIEDGNPIDEILEITSKLNKYDRKEVEKLLKIILNYSKEAGVNQADIWQLLNTIIENV